MATPEQQTILDGSATNIRWGGPECVMCRGTGNDFTYSGEPMTTVRRDVPTGLPCRTCNGHGREAS